jgi:hypothetical protein
MKINYVDVHGARKVSVVATWNAPGANPYTLDAINTPQPVNYGGLDETITLYTIFKSIEASVLRKAQSDISGKINSVKWGCDGKEAWITVNVAPGNANVNAALQSIAKYLCPLSNNAKYAQVVRTFGVSADKDAFMAAAVAQHHGVSSVNFLVIGKVSSIKDDVRSKYDAKVKELISDITSMRPDGRGAKRTLEAKKPEYNLDITLKSPQALLVPLYLSKIFREVEMDIHGNHLVSKVRINLEKAASDDKISNFAEKIVKALKDEVGCHLALYGAEHALLSVSDLVTVANARFTESSITSVIKSHIKA